MLAKSFAKTNEWLWQKSSKPASVGPCRSRGAAGGAVGWLWSTEPLSCRHTPGLEWRAAVRPKGHTEGNWDSSVNLRALHRRPDQPISSKASLGPGQRKYQMDGLGAVIVPGEANLESRVKVGEILLCFLYPDVSYILDNAQEWGISYIHNAICTYI